MPSPLKPPKPRRPRLKKQGLPTIFHCVNCGSSNSVTVKLDRKFKIAKLACKVCNERFSAVIHELSEEVDVYGAWIDEKECSDREGSTKETKQLIIKETSKNGSTARQSGNMLPKTKEPDLESPGPNSRTPEIVASERQAPINGSKDDNSSIKKSVIRQPRDTVGTKEHSTKRATVKGHSNNGSSGQTRNILAPERPAPIDEPNENNSSIKRSVNRQRRARQLTSLLEVSQQTALNISASLLGKEQANKQETTL